MCDAEPACISFEFRTSDGKCYLSSSCNQASAGYAVGDTFNLYIKQHDGWYHSPSPPPPSPSIPPPSPLPPPPSPLQVGGWTPYGAPRPLQNGNVWAAESWVRNWSYPVAREDNLKLHGDLRAYFSLRPSSRQWGRLQYDKLRLLGKTLRWTVDLSSVACGCNLALYLVSMPLADGSGSRYCDINTNPPCLEIDLMEGNIKALKATLHTQRGQASDGTCNQWGCGTHWGPPDHNGLFGIGSPNVDSSRPFRMSASFDPQGRMAIDVEQGAAVHRLWDVWRAKNGWGSVPASAIAGVKRAHTVKTASLSL